MARTPDNNGRRAPCGICGELNPLHGLCRGLCYGCCLDGLLPRDYHRREAYAYHESVGHQNAQKHPATGVPILDMTPTRPSQLDLPPGMLREMPLEPMP